MENKNSIKYTGGSRIGSANLTFPFASLIISDEKLQLNASIKSLIFYPKDLITVEEVYYIPFVGQGVKIIHNSPNYHKNIIFWSFTSPQKIIQEIKRKDLLQNQNNIQNSLKKSVSRKEDKFLIPPVLVVSFFVLIIMAGLMFNYKSKESEKYTSLGKESSLDIKVRKMRVDHGISLINRRISVPGGTRLISERPEWFKTRFEPIGGNGASENLYFSDLYAPFHLHKDTLTFELKVVKNSDTLIFEIPDPDYKDPNDPTFKDLFQEVFSDNK